MGGGRKSFDAESSSNLKDISDKNMCTRTDGKNLINEWIRDKAFRGLSHKFLDNIYDINMLDTENTDYVLGKYEIR